MLVAKTERGEVKILFRHQHFQTQGEDGKLRPDPQLHTRMSGKEVLITAETTALILQGEKGQEQILAQGKARCSKDDNFQREEARQVALFHALGINRHRPKYEWLDRTFNPKLTFPPEVTGAILSAYFGRKRGLRGKGGPAAATGVVRAEPAPDADGSDR